MDSIEYIMVTNWTGHWDHFLSPVKKDRHTIFTHSVIRDPALKDGPWIPKARTLFIKLNAKNQFEKSWIGYSSNFETCKYKEDKPAVSFEVSELREFDCPETFKSLTNGWHLNPENIRILKEPIFFSYMKTCNWEDFEEYSFQLLRLLGIHDIFKYPQSDNGGKPDGFFVLHTLAVFYDATLKTDFGKTKKAQINNYVGRLKDAKVKEGKRKYSFQDKDRQVWIITRGNDVNLLRIEDNIKVKEIPYSRLINIYHDRLSTEMDAGELCNLLRELV